jgi:uncharacterized ferritin-like protein (DUF455 family)
MAPTFAKGRSGNEIAVGDKVRVLSADPKILQQLSKTERKRAESMVGEIFEVYEVDEHGHSWVEKWWHFEDGKSRSHSLALLPEEIEKISG